MSFKNNIVLITASVLMGACASKKDLNFDEIESKDLVKKLDIKKITFDKFKTDKLSVEEERKIHKKNIARKKNIKKISSIKKSTKINTKINSDNIKKLEIKELYSYGKDYPENYKLYDQKSIKTWKKFTPHFFNNEEFTMSVSYLGITAGHIRLKTKPRVKIDGKVAYHFQGLLKSAKFYNYIYSLDDSIDTFLDATDFLPIKYSMIQRESGQDVDDLQLFDRNKNKTYFWYNKVKKGKTTKREKEAYIPHYFQDSFSALYFVRGLPLNINDEYEFPIVTRAKIWIMKMKVEKKETIKIMGKAVSALRINAVTRFPGVLKKKGDIIFWYSNDKFRKLLKFEAKVKIGTIEGELINYIRGDQRISSMKHFENVKDKK